MTDYKGFIGLGFLLLLVLHQYPPWAAERLISQSDKTYSATLESAFYYQTNLNEKVSPYTQPVMLGVCGRFLLENRITGEKNRRLLFISFPDKKVWNLSESQAMTCLQRGDQMYFPDLTRIFFTLEAIFLPPPPRELRGRNPL
jgi:hypothetical protein